MQLTAFQWSIAALGALGIGLSKTGVPGLGILAVALFAIVLPGRVSVGVVLPLLICGDVIAVTLFRRHAVWPHLWRIFPWAAAGVVLGFLALGHINDTHMSRLIGAILIALVTLQGWRRRHTAGSPTNPAEPGTPGAPRSLWFVVTMGLLAGFTTMTANAAGPIMILYLLSMDLPKMEFVGTGAWFYLTLNLFKTPFSVKGGLITPPTLLIDLKLALFTITAALFGGRVLRRFDQGTFEGAALALTLLAAIRLLVYPVH